MDIWPEENSAKKADHKMAQPPEYQGKNCQASYFSSDMAKQSSKPPLCITDHPSQRCNIDVATRNIQTHKSPVNIQYWWTWQHIFVQTNHGKSKNLTNSQGPHKTPHVNKNYKIPRFSCNPLAPDQNKTTTKISPSAKNIQMDSAAH